MAAANSVAPSTSSGPAFGIDVSRNAEESPGFFTDTTMIATVESTVMHDGTVIIEPQFKRTKFDVEFSDIDVSNDASTSGEDAPFKINLSDLPDRSAILANKELHEAGNFWVLGDLDAPTWTIHGDCSPIKMEQDGEVEANSPTLVDLTNKLEKN